MIGQDGEHSGPIDSDATVTLYWDADQPIDTAVLHGVLDQPRSTAWSGVTIGPNEPFDGVWLRLTATEPGTCRIAADQRAVDTSRCTPAIPARSPAIAEGASLAYFTLRRLDDAGEKRRWELGAIGHGTAGSNLADRLCKQIRAWDNDRDAQPVVTGHSMATPGDQVTPALPINKPCTRMVVTY